MAVLQLRGLSAILVAVLPSITLAHTRLECPPPRSGNTGEKVGPCDAPDDPSLPAYPLMPNALNTITWLESISHPGAPARFALSLDGQDEGFETCLLLDHVPHDEYSRPTFDEPLTFHRSSITLFIPDIYCERCHLQLLTIMSDEIHGVPTNFTCAYNGAKEAGTISDPDLLFCPVVYHSCAPVSINGTVPRNDISVCQTDELQEKLDWPFMTVTEENEEYSAYYNKGNPGIYNQTDARLLSGGAPIRDCFNFAFCDPDEFYQETVSVPSNAKYATLAGSCASMVGMEVENFVLGKLPDQQVFIVDAMDNYPADCDSTVCQEAADCFTTLCNSGDSSSNNNETTNAMNICNDPIVTTCEHCFPESPCSSAMQIPGIGITTDMDASSTIDEGGEEPDDNMMDGNAPEGSSGALFVHGFPVCILLLVNMLSLLNF